MTNSDDLFLIIISILTVVLILGGSLYAYFRKAGLDKKALTVWSDAIDDEKMKRWGYNKMVPESVPGLCVGHFGKQYFDAALMDDTVEEDLRQKHHTEITISIKGLTGLESRIDSAKGYFDKVKQDEKNGLIMLHKKWKMKNPESVQEAIEQAYTIFVK